MSSIYRGIRKQNGSVERASALSTYERLAKDHPEYRRVVRDVASARSHEEEIDTLLKWYKDLTHDVIHGVVDEKTGELARYDHDTVHPQSYAYSFKDKDQKNGLHDTDYAGSLDDEGASTKMKTPIYSTLFVDLYAEVIQLVAYTHYKIQRMYHDPNIVPVSACDQRELDRRSYKTWDKDQTK